MNIVKTIALGSAGLLMAGCVSGFEGGPRDDKTVDAGFHGNKDLSQWQAGIWVDPTGCDHWIIDDGIEGYLSARLAEFFRETGAAGYVITGHTDSRASDAYSMRLSLNRANAVAVVGRSAGANIVDVRGYGERQPRASNKTQAGLAQNRRVEIICIR